VAKLSTQHAHAYMCIDIHIYIWSLKETWRNLKDIGVGEGGLNTRAQAHAYIRICMHICKYLNIYISIYIYIYIYR